MIDKVVQRCVERMGDITVEKKLQLIQQVRSQYNRNQTDLQNREQLLYGRTSSYSPSYSRAAGETPLPLAEKEGAGWGGSFKIRLLAAIGLFLVILILDMSGKAIMGVPMERVFEMIARELDAEALENLEKFNFTALE